MFFSLLFVTKYYHRSCAGAYSADTLIESWQAACSMFSQTPNRHNCAMHLVHLIRHFLQSTLIFSLISCHIKCVIQHIVCNATHSV
jgi:hypothetical protein